MYTGSINIHVPPDNNQIDIGMYIWTEFYQIIGNRCYARTPTYEDIDMVNLSYDMHIIMQIIIIRLITTMTYL